MTPALRDPRNGEDDEIATSTTTTSTSISTSTTSSHSRSRTSTGTGTGTISKQRTRSSPKSCNAAVGMNIADLANAELSELLERCNLHSSDDNIDIIYRESFPMACRSLLHELDGNRNCVDCNTARDPEWAAISYGALVCIQCSGRHRSLGVAVSQVRSVSMDHWTHQEIILMLEGGNAQLSGFFARHALTKSEFEIEAQKKAKVKVKAKQQQEQQNGTATATATAAAARRQKSLTADNVTSLRYKTKAALFYKNHLEAHVGRLLKDPTTKPYKGRSRSSRSSGGSSSSSSPSSSSSSTTTSSASSSPTRRNNDSVVVTRSKSCIDVRR